MDDKPIPDFAIFQNSRTKQSALWLKEVGEWKRCDEKDYKPMSLMVNMIRNSPAPEMTLRLIARAITEFHQR
jgi:hypothetical protein